MCSEYLKKFIFEDKYIFYYIVIGIGHQYKLCVLLRSAYYLDVSEIVNI